MKITGKRADHFRYAFTYDCGETLFDCYKTPSAAKIEAYERCREKCYRQGGYNFCILSCNTFGFTCGWVTCQPSIGCTLHVETPKNSYEMEY